MNILLDEHGLRPRSIRQLVGREASLPHGDILRARIASLRHALVELRADNEQHAGRIFIAVTILLLIGGLATLPGMGALAGVVIGSGGYGSLGFILVYIQIGIITSQVPEDAIGKFAYGLWVWGADRRKRRTEMEESQHLYRIKQLNGSGLAELLFSEQLAEQELKQVYQWPAWLYRPAGKLDQYRSELVQFLAAREMLMRKSRLLRPARLGLKAIPTLILLASVPAAYSVDINAGHLSACGMLILFPAMVLANRNAWRLPLAETGSYLDRCMDYYERQGTLELPEEQIATAPPEILGTRLPLSMEALCQELRGKLTQGVFGEIGSVQVTLLMSAAIAIFAPLVLLAGTPELAVLGKMVVLVALAGVLFVYTTYVLMESQFPKLRQRYSARIRERGLFEQLISGILPFHELEEAAPVWLRHFLYLPSAPDDIDSGLGRKAWLLMWNVDWFLKGEGSSVRWDWSMQFAPVYVLGLAFSVRMLSQPATAFAGADDGLLPYRIWLVAYSVIALGICCLASQAILRHRAGALAMLEELEARLVEHSGSHDYLIRY